MPKTPPTITDVQISRSAFDKAKAHCTLSDGTMDSSFQWYDDEIDFTEGEFIGRTMDEMYVSFTRKDIAFIQS